MSVYYGECFPACLWWRSGRGGVILSRKCSDFPAGFDYFCSMNRRNFCKALAAVAAMAATAPASAAAMTGNCGRRCRLTVVRRMWVEDLQARYLDDPEAGPCPLLNQGQSWLIDGPVEAGIPPRGMCGRAWADYSATACRGGRMRRYSRWWPEAVVVWRSYTRCDIQGGL